MRLHSISSMQRVCSVRDSPRALEMCARLHAATSKRMNKPNETTSTRCTRPAVQEQRMFISVLKKVKFFVYTRRAHTRVVCSIEQDREELNKRTAS